MYSHTKICWNILGNGSCLPECVNRLFHKEVCENSLTSRVCVNSKCDKFHVKGTRRKVRVNTPVPKENEKEKVQTLNYHRQEKKVIKYNPSNIPRNKNQIVPDVCRSPNQTIHSSPPPLAPRKKEQNHVRIDQKYTTFADVVSQHPKPNHIVGQSSNLKMLNSKIANQQARIQNNESLVQQLVNQTQHQSLQIQSLIPREILTQKESHLEGRVQKNEDTLNNLNTNIQNLSVQFQNFENIFQSQINKLLHAQNLQAQNFQQVPAPPFLPEKDQTQMKHVYHYPGLLPHMLSPVAANATYTPL